MASFDSWFMAWWPSWGRRLFAWLNLALGISNLALFFGTGYHWWSLGAAAFNLGVAGFLFYQARAHSN